jgi:hypothetical protein
VVLCRRCAAAYFGKSPDWFDDHVRDGIPAVVVEGRASGWRREHLDRWLKLHTEGAWADEPGHLSPSTAAGSWWWVQFRIKGKRVREPTACSDRGAAEARAAGIWQEAKARAGEPAVGAVQRSLKLLGDDLLARVKGHGRAETYARDLEVDLRLHIPPRWQTPDAVTSASWESAREELHEDGQSWQSVKRIGKHLRTLLRFAKERGAISSVPEIRSPPRELIVREASETEPMTRRERDAFLADLSGGGTPAPCSATR